MSKAVWRSVARSWRSQPVGAALCNHSWRHESNVKSGWWRLNQKYKNNGPESGTVKRTEEDVRWDGQNSP
jgi:hypothetical protein